MTMRSPPPQLRLLLLLLPAFLLLCVAVSARVTDRPGRSYLWNFGDASFGDWCDETDECLATDENLECRNRRCQCRVGFRYKSGICKEYIRSSMLTTPRPPRLGGWCDNSADCAHVGKHLECNNGDCVCAEGYVLLRGVCKKQTRPATYVATRGPQLWDVCDEREDCAIVDENLVCNGGFCRCKPAYLFLDGLCKKEITNGLVSTPRPPQLGDWCEETEDCTLVDNNLECRASRCRCKDEHVLVNGLCQKENRVPERSPPTGDPCEETYDCTAIDGNLECRVGVCTCRAGFHLVSGLCKEEVFTTISTISVPRAPQPGDWCEEPEDCTINDENLECVGNICRCKDDYALVGKLCQKQNRSTTLSPTREVNYWCEESEDCSDMGENADCTAGVCQCRDGHFLLNGLCIETSTMAPATRTSFWTASTMAPATSTSLWMSWCTISQDCTKSDKNLECFAGMCLCKQGYEFTDGLCTKQTESAGGATSPPLPPLHSTTSPTSTNLPWYWTSPTLPPMSPTDYHRYWTSPPDHHRWYRTSPPDHHRWYGTSPPDHHRWYGTSPPDHHWWYRTSPTLPPTSPTLPPTSPTLPPTSPTLPPTPPTSPPTPPTSPATSPTLPPTSPTLPPTSPTSPPTPPTSPPTSAPSTSAPSPPPPSPPSPRPSKRTRPSKILGLGDECNEDYECSINDENMMCFSGICLCKAGYSSRDGECKKEFQFKGLDRGWGWEKTNPSYLGSPCEDINDCPTNDKVECNVKGFCQCIDGYADDADTCRKKIAIGGTCNIDTDICFMENSELGNMECMQGKCACKEGFVLHHAQCKKKIQELGASCQSSTQICYLETDGNFSKSECRDGRCQCKKGYAERNGMCSEEDTKLGSSCSAHADCIRIPNAECNDLGRCDCKQGYGTMNGRTCGRRVGDPCDDGFCDALNTQCLRKKRRDGTLAKICSCKKNHMASNNKTYCYSAPQRIGDLCDLSYCDFLGENVECIEGRCHCGEDYVLHEGQCLDNFQD